MENLNVNRVSLTKNIVDDFFEHVFTGEVAGLSNAKGLSYTLIYNLVHGRIHSLSVADYRRIFGEDPPRQEIATYQNRWLIPVKYLRETADREGFSIIREKYEWLAKNIQKSDFLGRNKDLRDPWIN